MDETNWDEIRKGALSNAKGPPTWPKNVRSISVGGISLLGVDEKHRLYWDGQQIEVRRALTFWQSLGAVLVVIATVIGAVAMSVSAYVAWFSWH